MMLQRNNCDSNSKLIPARVEDYRPNLTRAKRTPSKTSTVATAIYNQVITWSRFLSAPYSVVKVTTS